MTYLRLPPLPTIRDLVKVYHLHAVKQLSQNFLMDERMIAKIVKKSGRLKCSHVLEVGPGPGGITRAILRRMPERLIVVEKDRRFKPFLDMLIDAFSTVNGKMEVIYEDIKNLPMDNLFPEQEKKNWDGQCPNINLIGNLPFNISTPLIIQWLHQIAERRGPWSLGRVKMTLTFQKEVAERLVAEIASDQRSRLSVMAQAWTYPQLQFIIPSKAFVPKPEVDVGVVTFTPLIKPRTNHDFKLFEKITRHVFSFRQKYNIKCIGTLFPPELRDQLSLMMFRLCDLEPSRISTQLSVEDVDKLCTAYKFLCEKHPEIINYNYRASSKILARKWSKNIRVEACM